MIDFLYKYEAIIRLSVFLGGFSLLALWEWIRPKRELTQDKIKRWLNNVGLVVCSTIAVRVIVPTAAIGMAYIVEQEHLGIINHFDFPLWIKIIITFILLDLSIYFQHVFFHVIPILWRFHRVHHSDLDCDVSTGVRFHPVEILLSILIKISIITMLGAPILAVIIFEMILNLMSMFTHSNINLNKNIEKILRWFIVTPDMHRVHHSTRENETNSNFCFHISLWDRIFGTYIAEPEAGHTNMIIGLDHFREPNWQSFKGLMHMPFSSEVRGYAVNYRDTKNADELELATELAIKNQEKASLAIELASYLKAIGQHALVSATDPAGRIIQVNERFCEISGYSESELLGQSHSIVNSGTHPKGFFEKMWRTIASGNNWQGEVCNRDKNGKLYWVDSTIMPIKDKEGNIERYISVRLDITDRILYEAEIAKAYEDLSRANSQLEKLSRVDGLTNLSNRRHFDEMLATEINRMSRSNQPLTFILCDIDYFKNYNDTYGHLGGDDCLRKVAKSIKLNFSRPSDIVARYGGEEFAVILPDVKKEAAIKLAERMRVNLQELGLPHESSVVEKTVTLSAGVITLVPDKHTTNSMFIEKADKALYMAKEKGRNNIQYFE